MGDGSSQGAERGDPREVDKPGFPMPLGLQGVRIAVGCDFCGQDALLECVCHTAHKLDGFGNGRRGVIARGGAMVFGGVHAAVPRILSAGWTLRGDASRG